MKVHGGAGQITLLPPLSFWGAGAAPTIVKVIACLVVEEVANMSTQRMHAGRQARQAGCMRHRAQAHKHALMPACGACRLSSAGIAASRWGQRRPFAACYKARATTACPALFSSWPRAHVCQRKPSAPSSWVAQARYDLAIAGFGPSAVYAPLGSSSGGLGRRLLLLYLVVCLSRCLLIC